MTVIQSRQLFSTANSLDRALVEVRRGLEPVDPIVLKEDFCVTHKACIEFPPNVNDITTHEAVKRFQDHTADAIKHLDQICCCYSCFVNPIQLEHKFENDPILLAAFDTNIIYLHNLDRCGHDSEFFDFCQECWRYIRDGELPKYGISNKMSRLYCQHYPPQLHGLTTAEEVVIARAHPVVTILKLRPNEKFNPGSYGGVRGHSVLLPQNPGLLLTLLPSETTSIDDVLRIVWAGKSTPQPDDLSKFVTVS